MWGIRRGIAPGCYSGGPGSNPIGTQMCGFWLLFKRRAFSVAMNCNNDNAGFLKYGALQSIALITVLVIQTYTWNNIAASPSTATVFLEFNQTSAAPRVQESFGRWLRYTRNGHVPWDGQGSRSLFPPAGARCAQNNALDCVGGSAQGMRLSPLLFGSGAPSGILSRARMLCT